MHSPEAPAGEPVDRGWQLARTPPGAPLDSAAFAGLDWIAADVPGTVAGALRAAGRELAGLDDHDWIFRRQIELGTAAHGERVELCCDGIATSAELRLGGELLFESDSMFERHRIDVTDRCPGSHELLIRCRSLAPQLAAPRRPRARWRTQLADGGLRFHRTMLLGRAPGLGPCPVAVGPWGGVRIERRGPLLLDELALRPRIAGEDGELRVSLTLRALGATLPATVEIELDGPSGAASATLELVAGDEPGSATGQGTLRIARVARWWPHTHGEPVLHDVRVRVAGALLAERRVGFRSLLAGPGSGHDIARDGLALLVNGTPLFARGAVWTPIDPVTLNPSPAQLRAALEQLRGAGMNLVRLPGTGSYEQPAFHELCDELGLLVWQDLMFANFDYPIEDPELRAAIERELVQLIGDVGGRPSLAVVCGNSEVEQQVAMLGLDPALARGPLFDELVPHALEAAALDAVYVPSAPFGGTLPFRNASGVANYFGVGGYRRPLSDVRRAAVRFASECLALSNVPGAQTLGELRGAGDDGALLGSAPWRAGIPRDAGSDWDFEDVRDHYLGVLYGADAATLRAADPERYLELCSTVSGELMAAVFGEWRRRASPCAGGIVLALRDLAPGPGWGIVDAAGRPKPAWHALRRALAPIALWTTDEGLDGVAVHVANDGPQPLRATLEISALRGGETVVGNASAVLELRAHETLERDLEQLLGRFADASYAYRFGPPQQDAFVLALLAGDGRLLGEHVHFPAGPPLERRAADALGLAARTVRRDGAVAVELSCRSLSYGVRVSAPGHLPDDDRFTLVPGRARVVHLGALEGAPAPAAVELSALNLSGAVHVPVDRA